MHYIYSWEQYLRFSADRKMKYRPTERFSPSQPASQQARYSVGTQERFPQNIIACKWHLLNHDFEKKRGINNYEREKQEKYVFEDSG